MAYPSEKDAPTALARQAFMSDDRIERGLADALLRGLNIEAQMRQAAALERIADRLDGLAVEPCNNYGETFLPALARAVREGERR